MLGHFTKTQQRRHILFRFIFLIYIPAVKHQPYTYDATILFTMIPFQESVDILCAKLLTVFSIFQCFLPNESMRSFLLLAKTSASYSQ